MAQGRISKASSARARSRLKRCCGQSSKCYNWLADVTDTGHASSSDVMAHAHAIRARSKRDKRKADQLGIRWKTFTAEHARATELTNRRKDCKYSRLGAQLREAPTQHPSELDWQKRFEPSRLWPSPLLQLPAELRNTIFEMAVTEPHTIDLFAKNPSFASVNRQMRAEALSIYYDSNTFKVHLYRRAYRSRFRAWLNRLYNPMAKHISHILPFDVHLLTTYDMERLIKQILRSGIKLNAVDWGVDDFESSHPKDRSGRSGCFEFLPEKYMDCGLDDWDVEYLATIYCKNENDLHPLLRKWGMRLPLDLLLAWLQRDRLRNPFKECYFEAMLENGLRIIRAIENTAAKHPHIVTQQTIFDAVAKIRRCLHHVMANLRSFVCQLNHDAKVSAYARFFDPTNKRSENTLKLFDKACEGSLDAITNSPAWTEWESFELSSWAGWNPRFDLSAAKQDGVWSAARIATEYMDFLLCD